MRPAIREVLAQWQSTVRERDALTRERDDLTRRIASLTLADAVHHAAELRYLTDRRDQLAREIDYRFGGAGAPVISPHETARVRAPSGDVTVISAVNFDPRTQELA